mmetsp:Transcript_14736/g.32118  ORF Transcript_14736/g.32118 Transcript_14736/m.32118 type:complete len:253 (-) Transcript_14736:845-1603(-)
MSSPPPQERPNKRPRHHDNGPIERAYKGFQYTPMEPSGRPGTPHSFFKESYQVHQNHGAAIDNDSDQQSPLRPSIPPQVVHKHANGLVIVTAGNSITLNESASHSSSTTATTKIESISFHQETAPVAGESAATKRKQQAKMLKGKQIEGCVQPNSALATVKLNNGKAVELCACVWGSILEINPRITPELLANDPLLDGYLAVILPTGPFPPPPTKESKEESEKKTTAVADMIIVSQNDPCTFSTSQGRVLPH